MSEPAGPNLENYSREASDISQKGHFFEKKYQKKITILYSISFLSVLHQNKALHNFHKRGALSDCQMCKRSRLGPA